MGARAGGRREVVVALLLNKQNTLGLFEACTKILLLPSFSVPSLNPSSALLSQPSSCPRRLTL